jgi:glycosyltransferase involved in cell wall biosynthesis
MPDPRRILIATDAWRPQVNGVVRTLETTARELAALGHAVEVVHPGRFASLPCPVYPEIRLALPGLSRVGRMISRFGPTSVHVATEGPIGLAVRHLCRRRRLRFTTSYHTRFPEYLHRFLRIPLGLSYDFLRWFHGASAAVMVATPSLEAELRGRGFTGRIARWSRGVDLRLFHPRPKTWPADRRPIALYVGRVSAEKSVEEFLRLPLAGRKYVVGDGPQRAQLQREHPDAVFLGYLSGEALAEAYANADVFVFPSRTDTFGLVLVEALASGVPVAAYPVTGPIDIVTDERVGALDEDLGRAVERALRLGDPAACVALAQGYSWANSTRQFLGNLVEVRPAVSRVTR